MTIVAQLVQRYGPKYWPVLERLKQEYDALDDRVARLASLLSERAAHSAIYRRVIVSIGRVVLSLSFRHLRAAHCRAKSEANCASYRMESKGKRDIPRLFKGLRSLQCQESGAAEKTEISSLYLMITMA